MEEDTISVPFSLSVRPLPVLPRVFPSVAPNFPRSFSPDSSSAGVGSLLDSLHDVAVALRRTPLATYIVVKQISVNMISGPEVSQVD